MYEQHKGKQIAAEAWYEQSWLKENRQKMSAYIKSKGIIMDYSADYNNLSAKELDGEVLEEIDYSESIN